MSNETYGVAQTTDATAVFVARMRRERERRGWSQATLAAEAAKRGANLHPTAVTKLEWALQDTRRARTLRLNEALAIAAAFDLTPEQMLSDDDLIHGGGRLAEMHSDLQTLIAEQQAAHQSALAIEETITAKRAEIARALGVEG